MRLRVKFQYPTIAAYVVLICTEADKRLPWSGNRTPSVGGTLIRSAVFFIVQKQLGPISSSRKQKRKISRFIRGRRKNGFAWGAQQPTMTSMGVYAANRVLECLTR